MDTHQVGKDARITLEEIMKDMPELVYIPNTNRTVRVRCIKPYTIERLTSLWVERDSSQLPDSTGKTLESMCLEPYFSIKEACLFVLNGYFKIKLIYPIMWRIWAYVRGYTESQMMPIIQAGKKKIPLTEHWTNMAYSVDMRMDWKKMTEKEAEQYRAELISVANRLSSKNSPNMERLASEFGLGGTVAD